MEKIKWLAIYLAVLICCSTCSTQSEKHVEPQAKDCASPFEWSVPSDTIEGSHIYASTFSTWKNSYQHWMGTACDPLSNIRETILLTKASVESTGYQEASGLKIYFALDSSESSSIRKRPDLILVPYDVEFTVNECGDTVVFLNDHVSPDENSYFKIVQGEDSISTLLPIDETQARAKVGNWNSYFQQFVNNGFGNVYSYSFSKSSINQFLEVSENHFLSILFGLHSVSPNDPTFYFPPSEDEYPINGHLVLSLILGGRDPSVTKFMDFSSPCPRYCGKTDLWIE